MRRFVRGKFCESSSVVRPLRSDNRAESERWFLKDKEGADITPDNEGSADRAGMKSFLFHLLVLFSPKINKEVLEDKYPGRKPPSVMPRPPIDPPKYVADYPDVDEMYKRFLAAKKDASSKPKKTRRGKRLFD